MIGSNYSPLSVVSSSMLSWSVNKELVLRRHCFVLYFGGYAVVRFLVDTVHTQYFLLKVSNESTRGLIAVVQYVLFNRNGYFERDVGGVLWEIVRAQESWELYLCELSDLRLRVLNTHSNIIRVSKFTDKLFSLPSFCWSNLLISYKPPKWWTRQRWSPILSVQATEWVIIVV